MSRLTIACTVTLAGLLAAGAGCASRTSAATQTTIMAFDPAASDPRAIEIADAVMTALGGEAAWQKTKEVIWNQAIILDGKVLNYVKHAWDRWNGRHQFTRLDVTGQTGVTMYELFGEAKYAYVQGEKGRATQMKEDTARMAAEARKQLDADAYRLFMVFKLKDPGVHLKFSEERPADGATGDNPPMKIDVIQVSFDPGVGPAAGDVWYVDVDKDTKMPLMIEHVAQGRPDNERSAVRLEDWKDAGGLKFPTRFTNVGYTRPDAPMVDLEIPVVWKDAVPLAGMKVQSPGEIILVTDIRANPDFDEDLYVPNVNLQ